MAQKDLYAVLGVSKDANEQEIRKAFKSKAKKYHPDISKEPDAEAKFKEIQEAYAILSDAEKKKTYDQFGYDAFQDGQGHGFDYSNMDFSDIFSEIFSSFGGGFGGFGGFSNQRQNKNGAKAGQDMQMGLRLTFKEAIFGVEKDFKIKVEEDCHSCNGLGGEKPDDVVTCSRCNGSGIIQTQQRTPFGIAMNQSYCPDCNGSGSIIKHKCHECHGSGRNTYQKDLSINFPKGVASGAHMRIPGKGQGGFRGGPSGDLYIYVEVETDNYFKREGNNIYIDMPIDYPTLVLGGKIDVPTIYGKVEMKIPKSCASGTKLKLKGKGVQTDHQTGDQIVEVNLKMPNSISKTEKELLEQLRGKSNHDKEHQNIFSKLKNWL